MKFCPNCGSKLARPGEDQFCMNCGAKIPVVLETPAEALSAAPPAVETPAFSGVPVTPPTAQGESAPPLPQQPRGEDLLNMIEEAQSPPPATPPAPAPDATPDRVVEDLFAAGGPSLFAEAQTLSAADVAPPAGQAPADLFAQSAPPQGQPDMFSSLVMKAAKPPPQAQQAADAAQTTTAHPADKSPAPPQKGEPAGLFGGAGPELAPVQSVQNTPQDLFGESPTQNLAQTPAAQDVLFSTAAMQARDEDPLFQQDARAPAPPRAPGRGDTHSQTAQRPRATKPQTAPRPLREQAFDNTQTQLDPAKPRRSPPPPVNLPEPMVEIKKPSVIGRVLTAFAVLIIFLVVCACTILIMLYFRNRPSQTIDDFTTAVSEVDVDQLNKLATVDGVNPTQEDWEAFCAAFSTTADLNGLKSQLLQMSEDEKAAVYDYPAVTITGKPFILFIERYTINIQAVSMLAPGTVDGTTAYLNDVQHTGTAQADGVLYTGLMPGTYQCRVAPPGVLPENVPPVDITIFGVDGPNYLDGEVPKVAVTISNCASDDAVLYVNDQPVPEVPVGGVVTIPNVALNSTIRISAIKDGVTMESSVVFNDLNTTQLAFVDYTQQGEPASSEAASTADAGITVDEINTLLGAFYQSYLECINQQSMDGIQNTTATANTSLASRIASDSNAGSLFQYTSVAVDAESITPTTSGDFQAVHFNATFQFNHKSRDTDEAYAASSNHQSVEMVYQDGRWLVNKMVFVSDGDFGSHTIAAFE